MVLDLKSNLVMTSSQRCPNVQLKGNPALAGNGICYPGDVVTSTGSVELAKLITNSVLLRRGDRLACYDIKKIILTHSYS